MHLLAYLHSPLLADAINRSMVIIPAGEFWMGSDDGRADEHPLHRVYLDEFTIDCFEVTNAQYAQYLRSTGGIPPRYWSAGEYPTGQADLPVVGMSWEDADAYCSWAGKRLPTEAEWEKSARGLDARLYPWGNAWDATKANLHAAEPAAANLENQAAWDRAWEFLGRSNPEPGTPALKPVGSYPQGQSPYGVMDMSGNASEWTADWYNWGDYSALPVRNPFVSGPPWNHVVRGSAWYDPAGNAEWVKLMSRAPARNSSHVDQDPRIGFRCAKTPVKVQPGK